jgi:hypothetical protein
LHALNLEKPIIVSELGFPTGPDTKRTAADLQRDLGIGFQVARDERTSGVVLWPFQTDYAQVPGDLFSR